MSISLITTVEDIDGRNKTLEKEAAGLSRFITPDPEILEGYNYSPLDYRLENERGAVVELMDIVENKKFVDKGMSDKDISEKEAQIKKEIVGHQEEIDNLEKQKIEVPAAVARLERLKLADKHAVCALRISGDTPDEQIKSILNDIEDKLNKATLPEERRLLNLLKVNLEGARTAIKNDGKFTDVNIYLDKNELKHLAKLNSLKKLHAPIAISMLENIGRHLTAEHDRLKDNHSLLCNKFLQPIEKLKEHVAQIKQDPKNFNNGRLQDVVGTLNNLSDDIQKEKEASPSFKDKLRGMVNKFRGLIKEALGVEIKEPSALRSQTLTTAFQLKQTAKDLDKLKPTLTQSQENSGPSSSKPRANAG